MFNGMMDPELIKLAQEQMSRISPSELAKIQEQMMSNPELIKIASESMRNMRPEDLRNAAEQLKYARTEDMVEIGEKMANASPDEIAAIRARADAQVTYELNAAQMLKEQGNALHSQGKFSDAAQKYLLAKNNLKGIPVSKARRLQLACSLNLMSCYLKTRQYDECIKEGSEVLAYDVENIKALYRRGQAYKELGLLEDAVSDLNKAHAVSPDDETIADVLRDTNERLNKGEGRHASRGLVIEEIIEEEEEVQAVPPKGRSSKEYSVIPPQEASECSQSQTGSDIRGPTTQAESLQGLKDDPEVVRSFQNFMSNVDLDTLASMSGGNSGMSPGMIKTASNMMSKMSPEELQKMLHVASSFQDKSPNSSGLGSLPPGISPDMLKTATDMMSKMPADELQKMFEIASSLKGKDLVSKITSTNDRPRSHDGSNISDATGISSLSENTSSRRFSNSRTGPSPSSNVPAATADLQEQMRDQMNDPAMRQMFTSMIKNMSPDMMANMSEQFGIKLSRDEAEKAQQAMSSLSPNDLDRMMRWVDRIQRGVEGAKKTKNWLVGRPGMILALCMLILAIILHWFGYIGR